jgi:hypothetical protein
LAYLDIVDDVAASSPPRLADEEVEVNVSPDHFVVILGRMKAI